MAATLAYARGDPRQAAGRQSSRSASPDTVAVEPVAFAVDPAGAGDHGAGGVHVVPVLAVLDPSVQHRAVVVHVVPGAANHVPAGDHGAAIVHVVPGAVDRVPAGDHGAGVVHVVPGAINVEPPGLHRSQIGIHEVPGSTDQVPAEGLISRGTVVLPGAFLVVPAGDHVSAAVEAVDLVINLDLLVHGVRAVTEVEPPADGVLLPGGGGSIGVVTLVSGIVGGRFFLGSSIVGGRAFLGGGTVGDGLLFGGDRTVIGGSTLGGFAGRVGGNDRSGDNGSSTQGRNHKLACISGTHS